MYMQEESTLIACVGMHPNKEPFTFIDKVVQDHQAFQDFVASQERSRAQAFKAVESMKQHPYFEEYCRAVGQPASAWEHPNGDPIVEQQLFQDWLAITEQDRWVAVLFATMETAVLSPRPQKSANLQDSLTPPCRPPNPYSNIGA